MPIEDIRVLTAGTDCGAEGRETMIYLVNHFGRAGFAAFVEGWRTDHAGSEETFKCLEDHGLISVGPDGSVTVKPS